MLHIDVPALRERASDIPIIAADFVQKLHERYGAKKQIAGAGLSWLEEQDWPGNVRELQIVIHRAYVDSDESVLTFGRTTLNAPQAGIARYDDAKARAMREFNRDYLTKLMELTGGNVTSAAGLAGKERRAMGRLLKKYDVDPEGHRATRR